MSTMITPNEAGRAFRPMVYEVTAEQCWKIAEIAINAVGVPADICAKGRTAIYYWLQWQTTTNRANNRSDIAFRYAHKAVDAANSMYLMDVVACTHAACIATADKEATNYKHNTAILPEVAAQIADILR